MFNNGIKYRPMPAESRFGIHSWLYNQEECYTEEELQSRKTILNHRQNSGLHPDLLQTDNSWFANDMQQAFVTVNANSWLLNPAYRPRKEITRNDFHIPLINMQLLKWRRLGIMTRSIGDYLLTRNEKLIDAHLNQPMNYVLLDTAQILKRLAERDNADFVANQLQLLNAYIRQVEILLSPFKGSDRLFLAEARRTLESIIQNDIEQQLQTQQLKVRIQQMRMNLNRIGEIRHTVLHFALTANTVNPHPYWEHFASIPDSDVSRSFPTLVAKSCQNAASETQAVIDILKHCPGFKFISELPEQSQKDYYQSLTDLQEILHFQDLLQQLLTVFDQAGELFTVSQFKDQIQKLLQHIEQYLLRSHQTILAVFNSNTDIYHHYIQAKQDIDASWLPIYLVAPEIFLSEAYLV